MMKLAAALLVLLATPPACRAQSNLVHNPSFEDLMTFRQGQTFGGGWRAVWESIDVWQAHAAEGKMVVDLDGDAPGGIQQGVQTVPGTTYTVTFSMGGNYGLGPTIKNLRVSFGNVSHEMSHELQPGETKANYKFTKYSFTAVASSTYTYLKFLSLTTEAPGTAGAVVDLVSVVEEGKPDNLVSYPSFETTTYALGSVLPGGWEVSRGNIDVWAAHAADGNMVVDLDGDKPGRMLQGVATVPGKAYRVTFAMGGNYYLGPDVKRMQLDFGTLSVNLTHQLQAGEDPWRYSFERHSYTVTATFTTTYLSFTSLTTDPQGSAGAVVDDVSVQAV